MAAMNEALKKGLRGHKWARVVDEAKRSLASAKVQGRENDQGFAAALMTEMFGGEDKAPESWVIVYAIKTSMSGIQLSLEVADVSDVETKLTVDQLEAVRDRARELEA